MAWPSWTNGAATTWAWFDVGFRRGNPPPLTDMGRFSHEALMVDPETGIV